MWAKSNNRWEAGRLVVLVLGGYGLQVGLHLSYRHQKDTFGPVSSLQQQDGRGGGQGCGGDAASSVGVVSQGCYP